MEQKNMILKNRVGSKKNASHYGYTVQFTVMTLYFSKKKEKKSEMTLCCSYWSLKCVDLYATIIYLYRITPSSVPLVMLLQLDDWYKVVEYCQLQPK